MAVTGWVAEHTQMPSIVPDRAGPVWAGDRLLAVIDAAHVGVPISDPLAPVGEPVTYTLGSSSVTLTRGSLGSHMVTDPTGHQAAMIRWLMDDSTDMGVAVTAMTTARGRVDRWPLVPEPQTVTLDCLTERDSTATMRTLAVMASRLVIVHDPTVCQIDGCDIPPIQPVTVTKASHQRTSRKPVAQRQWSLTCEARDGLEQVGAPSWRGQRGCAAPVVTWGEWEAYDGVWTARTYLEVCRLVAGMPA